MKKTILGLAILALSVANFSASAQKNNKACPQVCPSAQTCCAEQPCQVKGDCTLFEGINLSDAQKAQLKDLRAKNSQACKANEKARKEEARKDREAAKAERMANKRQYLQDVKSVLTPDQYVLFLENFFVNGGDNRGFNNKDFRGDRRGARKFGKDGRRCQGAKIVKTDKAKDDKK